MRHFLRFSPVSSGIVASALLCTASSAALAQVPSSAPVQLPSIEIENNRPARSRANAERAPQPKAPAAAQQSSKPAARVSEAAQPNAPADIATSVVSATGNAVPVEYEAASVTVVTSGEIDAQQRRTAVDVLKSVPGINVVQTNGPGGTTSLFTRGTNSNHTKVLIDGVDVSDSSSASRTFDFGQLLAMDIDRVEVLRGPQSGLYGADALGGVIVVYTKKGEKGPPVIEGLVEGGSFGTFNQAAAARGGVGAFTYSLNASHMYVGATPVTPIDLLPPGQQRNDNKYENWSYSARFGVDISPNVTLNLVGRYGLSDLAFTGDHYDTGLGVSVPDATRSTQHTEQYSGRAEAVIRSFGDRMRSYIGVNYLDTSRDYTSPTDGPSWYEGDRVKYDWRSEISFAPGTILTVGADHQEERMRVVGLSASESNTGVFGQLQIEPIRNLFLTANARLDDNENFGQATTWRISPAYLIEATGTKLKANVGTAFKAPSLDQRFHDYPAFWYFANPDLKPEESTGYDVGFEQSVFGGRAQFGAVYFHNDITNLIQSAYLPDFTSTTINIGNAKTEGVEAFIAADITRNLRIRFDYTHTKAINEDTGAELQRRPKDKFSVSAGWRPIKPLLLTGSVLYVGPTADVDRATYANVTLPGYTTVNIAAEYEINSHVTAFGRIDNLFDKQYQNPSGYEQTGIGAYAGLKFRN